MSAESKLDLDLSFDRVSTVDQVVDHLRSLIVTGTLKPGERLPENPLAQALGVSRNTVREAIPILVSEGLLVREHHRGAVVVTLTRDDIVDLYRVRRTLELSAVRDGLASGADVSALREAVDAMETASRDQDRAAMSIADSAFHAAIASLIGSPRLDRFFAQISSESRLAIAILTLATEGPYDDLEAVVEEHVVIYKAIAAGEATEACRTLEAHLDVTERRLIEIIDTRTVET